MSMDEIKVIGQRIQQAKRDKATAEGRFQTHMDELKRLGLDSVETAESELHKIRKRIDIINRKRESKLSILRNTLGGE